MQNVTPQQALDWVNNDEAVLIDVREDDEFRQMRIDGAVPIPVSRFDADAVLAAAGDKNVVFYCKSGPRAENACAYFTHVTGKEAWCMEGSIRGWIAAGLPVHNDNVPDNAPAPQAKTERFQLPSFEYAEKSLSYISDINTNNENRLNLYVTLNTGVISALGFLYQGPAIPGKWDLIALFPALVAILFFMASLALALSVSKSRVFDKESRMMTRWIARISDRQAEREAVTAFQWIFNHFRGNTPFRQTTLDVPPYTEYLQRVSDDHRNNPGWEVETLMREAYAMAHVARDRAIGLRYVRHLFTYGIIFATLAIVMRLILRALI